MHVSQKFAKAASSYASSQQAADSHTHPARCHQAHAEADQASTSCSASASPGWASDSHPGIKCHCTLPSLKATTNAAAAAAPLPCAPLASPCCRPPPARATAWPPAPPACREARAAACDSAKAQHLAGAAASSRSVAAGAFLLREKSQQLMQPAPSSVNATHSRAGDHLSTARGGELHEQEAWVVRCSARV